MTYIIVETPYEKCFDLFFKNELGYPNFYRLTELLPDQAPRENLILIAPSSPTQDAQALQRIKQKISDLQIQHCFFGENIETTFYFDTKGKLNTQSQFQEALREAVSTLTPSRPRP